MQRFSVFACLIIVMSAFAGATPAHARIYPWCIQGKGVGFPGDCSFSTRAQCLASASGRRVSCGLNPRAAYGQQRHRR
ncbi:DUF3551 domain-containing protein [Bradyrhizobium centrolobii]|uniref:DUF3551 domain-containing protein n=1 Tax=Bradyrhizobium centrolobii TaxID=1505087 RepID=UPI0024BF5DE8|nr:DUF3551 domain-containing protein [Bradyrhizobium centrolobii]